MNREQIIANHLKITEMKEKFGETYFELLGKYVMDDGLSIQDAIDKCWETLIINK